MIAPIDFGPPDIMQEIPGIFNPRTNKVEYPESGIMGGEVKPRMATEVFLPIFRQLFGEEPRRQFDGSFGIEDTPLNREAFPDAFINRGPAIATNFGDLKDYEKKILQDGLRIRQGHPSYDAEKLRLIKQYPGFQALIPRDDELGDIIRQQDKDIYDEYRKIDGDNPDPFAPLPLKAKGGNPFSTDALDKQKQIRDYLNNDQKIRDLFKRQGKMKAEGMTFAGDLFSA